MVRKHLKYASYVFRHKWFVFVEACKMRIGLRGLFHDMSKFRIDEWTAYANFFYGKKQSGDNGSGYCREDDKTVDTAFDTAWLKHIHRNPHHWQYWILREDEGDTKCLPMPIKFVLEMIADWKGAGKAQGHTGPNECQKWYIAHRDTIKLHKKTRKIVDDLMGV